MRKQTILQNLLPRWLRRRVDSENNNGQPTPKLRSGEVLPLEYQWINNEQLLREEGAVYGMLGQGKDDKLKVIENYFRKVSATLEVQIARENEALNALFESERKLQDQLEYHQSDLRNFPPKPDKKLHHFWRSLVGFVIYTLIIGATFYIVYLWLLPEFAGNTVFVSLGVFLFGALSLFGHFPFLLNPEETVQQADKREKWKVILEEMGIPVVATVFIMAFGYPHHPLGHSVAMGLFTLFVFLFAGKGLLASITALVPQWQLFKTNRYQLSTYKGKKNKLDATLLQLENELKDTTRSIKEKQELIASLRQSEAGAREECETRKSYFISEFSLAENSRVRYNFFD
jgi:hypothetical protein